MMEFAGKIESQRPTNPSNVKHQVVSGRFMYTQNTHKKVGRKELRKTGIQKEETRRLYRAVSQRRNYIRDNNKANLHVQC